MSALADILCVGVVYECLYGALILLDTCPPPHVANVARH